MVSLADTKQTDDPHVASAGLSTQEIGLVARADGRLAHAYEQIARADEQLARTRNTPDDCDALTRQTPDDSTPPPTRTKLVTAWVCRGVELHRTSWTPSIVPADSDETVYLVADDFGQIGRA
jgi:hypothetical protein